MPKRLSPSRVLAPIVVSLGTALTLAAYRPDGSVQSLTIQRIIPNHDSVKVSFAPIPGAADYRIYEAAHPKKVKYAGQIHRENPNEAGSYLSAPATAIEWNGIEPGRSTTLIVEAVDRLGPVPLANQLIDDGNVPVSPERPAICTGDGAATIGSNSGPTPDGKISVNGQGMPTGIPKTIARSRPFTVTATGKTSLPSGPDASQILFETFSNGTIEPIGEPDIKRGTRNYLLRTPTAEWEIPFQGIDLAYTQPFLMDRHYMDLLFDGPLGQERHRGRSATALTPRKTADFSGKRILHLTMEIDGHVDGHRWIGFNLSPADDPINDLYWSRRAAKVNRRNQAFFCEITDTRAICGVIDDKTRTSPKLISDSPLQSQGDIRSAVYASRVSNNGQGLDNRSRFDLFINADRFALFEDGKQLCNEKIVGGLPFTRAKTYFSHFLYHSADERTVLETHAPHERYWREQFPFSDERHWDNMGFEVLPATTNWAKLGQRITVR